MAQSQQKFAQNAYLSKNTKHEQKTTKLDSARTNETPETYVKILVSLCVHKTWNGNELSSTSLVDTRTGGKKRQIRPDGKTNSLLQFVQCPPFSLLLLFFHASVHLARTGLRVVVNNLFRCVCVCV